MIKPCNKCKKVINPEKLHKVVMDVVGEKFVDQYYEHTECPGELTV